MQLPMLLMADKILEMDQSSKTADLILKFSNERRKLSVDNFIARHIEILAQIFKVPSKEIALKVDLPTIISKYLDCLEFTARAISKAAQ